MTEITQRSKKRKYAFDALASVVFWVPIYIAFNMLGLHLEIWQVLVFAGFSAVINFAFGGVFGHFLDWWRKKLSNHY